MGLFQRISRGLLSGGRAPAHGKPGCRAYAIGDIHGRLDLLNRLLREVEADLGARAPKKTFIIFLGDLVDRGAESAGVVERLRAYSPMGVQLIFLAGNHEEVLLRILAGDRGILPSWLKFGGAECAASYGLDVERLSRIDEEAAIRLVQAAVPPEHRVFLESFADTFRFGDYLFVHAGIRPGIAVEAQEREDLLWIREPFLNDTKEHGCVIVHGHTIVPEVEERHNRIAIDTGAYQSGVLTAIGIEDDERWFLATGAARPTESTVVAAR
jgi:calcineurin-like phosphoesterase family protein